jgi:hybrid cluster-associated redox disulfide protein
MPIDNDSLVDEIMREYPETIRVFLDYRMNCVGCPIGTLHTVNDSCREHGVDAGEFLGALRAAADLSIDTDRPKKRSGFIFRRA